MIDLDEAPTPTDRKHLPALPWVVAFVATVVAAVLAGTLLPRPAATDPGVRPRFTVTATSLPGELGVDPAAFFPTTAAYYADGTSGEAYKAMDPGGWVPDRPVLMLTVAAGVACSIQVDGRLEVNVRAPVNRVAVCVWTAPTAAS